jgi:hypothetical protein
MNNDTATANVVFRLTRSAQTYEWITQAATRQRAELSSPLFVLHAGDVLEAMAAHTVALSQTLRVYYNAVPVQVP